MNPVHVSAGMPRELAEGLSGGVHERVGGAIREIATGQIIAFLREAAQLGEPIASELLTLSSTPVQASALNLALTTMQFAVVMKRLSVIEAQLKQAQTLLESINYQIDLSFYANFRAALDLAANAFRMTSAETRRVSAMQAINRFLEAEHHYANLADVEIANQSQVADDYLSTLCLAYITEVRCYLELNELDTAIQRLREGVAVIRPKFEKHLNNLLTSNPAAYLHPSLKDQIDLARLTRVYRWLTPGIDANAVFEAQRANLFKLARRPEDWAASLPQAIRLPVKSGLLSTRLISEFTKHLGKTGAGRLAGWVGSMPSLASERFGLTKQEAGGAACEPSADVFARLPEIFQLIELMIEQCCRFETYLAELEALRKLNMSFEDWRQLAPAGTAGEAGLICVVVAPIRA